MNAFKHSNCFVFKVLFLQNIIGKNHSNCYNVQKGTIRLFLVDNYDNYYLYNLQIINQFVKYFLANSSTTTVVVHPICDVTVKDKYQRILNKLILRILNINKDLPQFWIPLQINSNNNKHKNKSNNKLLTIYNKL